MNDIAEDWPQPTWRPLDKHRGIFGSTLRIIRSLWIVPSQG